MPIKLLLIVKDLHNLSAVLLTIQAVPFSRAGECIEDQRSCQHSESSFFEVSDSPFLTGDDRDRTDNLCLARAALSQLSYVPEMH